jgi:hypothetical protein
MKKKAQERDKIKKTQVSNHEISVTFYVCTWVVMKTNIFWVVFLFSKFLIKDLCPSSSSQHCRTKSQVEVYYVSGFSHKVFSNNNLLRLYTVKYKFFLFFGKKGGSYRLHLQDD